MAIKKSELYSSLWASCDELRGGMDASQYKDYILVFLFIKYVSDKYGDDPNGLIEIPKGSSFADMVALKGTPNIGDDINKKILAPIAEANELKGVIDLADFADPDKLGKGKEMVDRLSNLIAIFENEALDFSKNQAEGDDILGDAYEYLMRNFATQSGKSKGQFYTPAEVSRILAKVINIESATSQEQSVYDPTCGSGSLLLKAADEAKTGLTIYGQEMDNATTALAKMNMILHGHVAASEDIRQGNTLANPLFKNEHGKLKKFDFAVANPPFSTKSWSNGFSPESDEFGRFEYGIPPAKNGDYAFLLHIIKSLKQTGKGAVILPHGVLFRGNAEATIRENLLRQGLIKGIIGLPANLFYGTGIPACIIVIDKEQAATRTGVFMIDASKGFLKDGNKNRLRERDIHNIVDVFNGQKELLKYSRLVTIEEIRENDFNLNIPRYIDTQEAEDIHDIAAHLSGGIPKRDVDALESFLEGLSDVAEFNFAESSKENYRELKVAGEAIKNTIFNHPEFVAFGEEVDSVFSTWKNRRVPMLKNLDIGCKPKQLIGELSEDLLETFAGLALIDKYDIYQHLMNYWSETMQDDVYQIAAEGWKAEVYLITDKKGKQKGWDCDLVPKQLVINRYFAEQKAMIEKLEAEVEAFSRKREEIIEEHGGEDGLLDEVKNDKGNIAKAALPRRIKALKPLLKTDPDAKAESEVLTELLGCFTQEKATADRIKKARAELDKLLFKKYKTLQPDEIKTLVVDDKWMPTMAAAVQSEQDNISQRLTRRIKELADRYGTPLPALDEKVADLTEKSKCSPSKNGFGMELKKQVPEGYKMTEIGVIPVEWEVKKLEKVTVDLIQGVNTAIDIPEYVNDGIPMLKANNVIDGEVEFESSDQISLKTFLKYTNRYKPNLNDFLYSNIGARLGTGSLLKKSIDCSYAWNVMRIIPGKNVNPVFLEKVMNSSIILTQVKENESGSGMGFIPKGVLKQVFFPLPPTLTEQTAIANALSDADALIAGLDDLIAKKRQIKQGAMQQLLTPPSRGGKRLEGFSGEWKEKKIGEIAEIYQPITISQEVFSSDGFPVYGANGVVGFYKNYNHEHWQTVITCRGSTCGTVNKTVDKSWITGNAMVINVDQKEFLYKIFIFHLLSGQDFSKCITGSGQPQIVRDPIANFLIFLPSTLAEQTAIANILSDMDTEIEALEGKREKYRRIKQGMMQELLTGRVRLV